MTAAEMLKKQGRNEGLRQGREEGRRDFFLKQLRFRFGFLPKTVTARVQAAPPAQLDRWAERVLTAATLDEVLAARVSPSPRKKKIVTAGDVPKKQGRRKKRDEEYQVLLLRALHFRFGLVPEAVWKRIQAATFDQVVDWLAQALTAATLDEALAVG